MTYIASIGTAVPSYRMSQSSARQFASKMFSPSFQDVDRLLPVFEHAQIDQRHLVMPLEWLEQEQDFQKKNDLYIEKATELGEQAIDNCLSSLEWEPEDIDCLIFISTTGIATPSIDARLMNRLNMNPHLKRTPIWGLGCAGGAAGLARAFEYARGFPQSKVLVVALELCSLNFLRNDISKSNFIATSLFADGAAATLVIGAEQSTTRKQALPKIIDTQSTLWQDSLDVMGWDVTNEGLKVVFSRDIPTLVHQKMKANVEGFLASYQLSLSDIDHFITHPGGKKVLSAYQAALNLSGDKTQPSEQILQQYGNMSSATVLFVLNQVMKETPQAGEYGLISALGPGFSCELLLVQWQ